MAEIFTAEHMVALLTLVTLEIVLGIDNVIFIAILSGKLPENQQARARSLGIGLAVITRVLLLSEYHLHHAPDRAHDHPLWQRPLRAGSDPVDRWSLPDRQEHV